MNIMTLNLLVGFHANRYFRTKSLVSIVTRSNSWVSFCKGSNMKYLKI
jgi:hypothetical protein